MLKGQNVKCTLVESKRWKSEWFEQVCGTDMEDFSFYELLDILEQGYVC